jgi:hypothetical protein
MLKHQLLEGSRRVSLSALTRYEKAVPKGVRLVAFLGGPLQPGSTEFTLMGPQSLVFENRGPALVGAFQDLAPTWTKANDLNALIQELS